MESVIKQAFIPGCLKKQTVASGIVLRGIPHQANSCYVVATNAPLFRQMNQPGKP